MRPGGFIGSPLFGCQGAYCADGSREGLPPPAQRAPARASYFDQGALVKGPFCTFMGSV
jgi:hypothetical protein